MRSYKIHTQSQKCSMFLEMLTGINIAKFLLLLLLNVGLLSLWYDDHMLRIPIKEEIKGSSSEIDLPFTRAHLLTSILIAFLQLS
jgi:hypothetical protein